MWPQVMLLVSFNDGDELLRNVFDNAMLRRGWSKVAGDREAYRATFEPTEDDDAIVQECEHDVKQSAYVAGVGRYQASCMIASDRAPASDPD